MEIHCLVISGGWRCSVTDEWEFVVDKERMSRLVSLRVGIGLKDLEEVVLQEFCVSKLSIKVSFSYWPANGMPMGMGSKTPPVLLTTDSSVGLFLGLLEAKGSFNLFVSFDRTDKKRTIAVLDGSQSFNTPVVNFRKFHDGVSTQCDGAGIRNLFVQDFGGAGAEIDTAVLEDVCTVPDSGCSETNSLSIDDEELLIAVEIEEEKLRSGDKGKGLCEDMSHKDTLSPSCEVRASGYDQEFWAPLLEDEFGGSNAVDIMCSNNPDPHGLNNLSQGSSSHGRNSAPTSKRPDDHTSSTHGCSSVDRASVVNSNKQITWPASRGRPFPGRRLETVDNEEFDIQPLIDDNDYASAEIPDMDRDDDESISIGKVFNSKMDCQIALAIYAIKNQFCFKQTRSQKDYFVVNCVDEKCDWRVMAHEMTGTSYYEIKKTTLAHSCSTETRSGYQKKATNKVLAAVYKSRFTNSPSGTRPMDLQQMVLEDLRVSASYMKCWRVKQTAIGDFRGVDAESYMKLPTYLRLLKAANPGTIADLETDVEEDGRERFLYLFLAFGASIEGFRKLRPLLILDGTHLSGPYKGVLLTVSGQDANFQVFPLAFGIVDSENDDSWTWFLLKVERIIADSPSITIISDRHASIYTAKSRVFPKSHHGACLVHLQRNVNSKFKNKGLANLVGQAARAYKVGIFREFFNDIRSRNQECAKFLEKIGIAHWSRAYFSGERYNLMTSNIAESLNNALRNARGSHIIELLLFIRTMMSRWFNARRLKSERHQLDITIEADRLLTRNMNSGKGSKLGSVNTWTVEVLGPFGGKNFVLLNDKKCSCKVFDKLKFPCSHALFAADHKSLPYANLVSDYYKTTTWRDTYKGVINPEADPQNEEPCTQDLLNVLLPPKTKRPSGRPRLTRFLSKGEIPVSHVMYCYNTTLFNFRFLNWCSFCCRELPQAKAAQTAVLGVIYPATTEQDAQILYNHDVALLHNGTGVFGIMYTQQFQSFT